MPPKSATKKDQITWLLCEKCKVYVTSKDRDEHGDDCPLPDFCNETNGSGNVKYSFIQNKKLFLKNLCEKTDLTGCVSEELLNDLSSKYLNNLVFASESVMNLCNWIISDFVTLQSTSQNVVPVVRRIWPITDKSASNVFVTDEGGYPFSNR